MELSNYYVKLKNRQGEKEEMRGVARGSFGGRAERDIWKPCETTRPPQRLLLFNAINSFLGICYMPHAWLGAKDTEMIKKQYLPSLSSVSN